MTMLPVPQKQDITFLNDNSYQQYYIKSLQHPADYSHISLNIYKEFYNLSLCYTTDLCFIQQNNLPNTFWAPMGNWMTPHWYKYILPQYNYTFLFVPEALCLLWKDIFSNRIHVEESRNDWDYIYKAEDLATLPGAKYVRKRNHYNAFKRRYSGYTLHEIQQKDSALLYKYLLEWNIYRQYNFELLESENKGILFILENWDAFHTLYGIYIQYQEIIIGFSIAEAISKTTCIIQTEKGNTEYPGIFQAINKIFSEYLFNKGYTLLNRADDNGHLGLRKAKEEYYPIEYIKKYTVALM
ncbi:MAG: phosphatidylglycerol lysyltransferase domain-containing protein [Desulfovibrionaceae bacterium]